MQKNLPRKAELARQVSRYLWRGSVDFKKKKSTPFFIIIFKLKNGNFKTRDFSPLIERVLVGVCWWSDDIKAMLDVWFFHTFFDIFNLKIPLLDHTASFDLNDLKNGPPKYYENRIKSLDFFTLFLIFSTSKFHSLTIRLPLTSMTSKTVLPNILKIE